MSVRLADISFQYPVGIAENMLVEVGTLLEEEIFAEFDEFMAMTADENSDSNSDTKDPPFEKITINTDYKIKTSLEEPPKDLNNLNLLPNIWNILETDEVVDSDSCIWSFFYDDNFLINKVRKHIDERILPILSPSTQWYKVIPKKVNILMWRLFLDRLPNRLNLSSRGLDIDSITCPVCNGSVESNAHTFFACDTASAVWRLVRSWTGSTFLFFNSCDD
ncbi:RNA-directed DNA polymerase, eukaryota [Tanacetum coccineum]